MCAPKISLTFELQSDSGVIEMSEPVAPGTEWESAKGWIADKWEDSIYKLTGVHRFHFEKWVWPGGYAAVYTMADGEVVCPDCLNDNLGLANRKPADAERDWRVVSMDVFWEGPAMRCANCDKDLPSECGDLDEDLDENEG